jgi:serine phosphatase RsbU (regulator of sigma subunit)/predicted ester cyclase
MSVEEENKALVRRFLEAHAKGDVAVVGELLAPDFVNHNPIPGQVPDREGYLQGFIAYHAAFSDSRYVIEKQIAEGDEVLTIFSASAAHNQEYMGLAPAGKGFEALLFLVHRLARGRITDEWSQGSGLAELTQRRLEQEMRERERVEQELRVAQRTQQASLPTEVPELEGWEITPYYQPAREVGGDFYDFFELDDGRVGLAVGDATGKGMPAALAVTATCSMLRAVARDSGNSPGEALSRVNETLVARIPPNMFVTCFYAILELQSGRLSFANAGHNLPCCSGRRNDEGTATTDLVARGMPLGLMPQMTYEEQEISLAPAERVLFYTDGLIEAHSPQGEMFGTPRLRDLLSERAGEGGTGLSATLMEKLGRFTGEGWEQEDDITLLTLQRVGSTRPLLNRHR